MKVESKLTSIHIHMAFIAKPSWKKKEKNENFIGKMKILLKKWKILFEIIENFIGNY